MDVFTGIIALLNSILSAPLGQAIVLVLVVALSGYYLRGWSKDRLATKRIEAEEAQNKRDGEIRKMEIENQRKEDDRHALHSAETNALLRELTNGFNQLAAIASRQEVKASETHDLLKQTKDNTEAIAHRGGLIHEAVRQVDGKLLTASADVKARLETLTNTTNANDAQTWGLVNTRTQKVEASVDNLGDRIQRNAHDLHTAEMSMFDVVLNELRDVGKALLSIQKDFKDNNEAQANANAVKSDESRQLSEVLRMVGNIFEFVKTLKGSGQLRPESAIPPTIAAVVNTGAFADPPIGHIPKRNTDPLPPLPPINAPVVQSGQPDTPFSGKHDTQPLPITPSVPAKPPEDTPR